MTPHLSDKAGRADEPAGSVLLLCPAQAAPYLAAILAGANPDLSVISVSNDEQLARCAGETAKIARIISFWTNSIVPAHILERVSGTSYNFHPGPPAYPGRYPFVFALYDGASHYGVTAHEMVRQVDAGPIVGMLGFSLPPDPDPTWLASQAHAALIQLFLTLAPALARTDQALPHTGLAWDQRRRCTRKALEALCAIPADADRSELERRIRALRSVRGEGVRPHLSMQGHRFWLDEG